jgi:hypothetical protein
MAEDTSHSIRALPDCPAWCTTNHRGAIYDPVHWTSPYEIDTLGEHAPAVREQVRVQGSVHLGEDPPARVHVDTRLSDRTLWKPVLVMTPGQTRAVATAMLDIGQTIGDTTR